MKNTSKELDKTKQILKSKASEILKLKTEKIALQKKVSSEKKKVADAKELVNNIKLSVENDKREVDLKQKEVQIKEKELEYLESLLTDDKIQTFHDGKYMDHIRLTIMELLSMNVSINKVNDVIRTVIKRLTNKEIDKLPSKGLRCQFLIEARHLADLQIGHAMLEGTDLNSVLGNTLHGDGTSKYHRHFQNFQVTTSEGQSLSAGLLEIVGQDAQTLLEAWQERVEKLPRLCLALTQEIT